MLIDISMPIRPGMSLWPGDPELVIERAASLDAGDSCNLTRIALSVHTGTHIDAPAHFLADGGTLDDMDLETLIGPARVIEALGRGTIAADDVDRAAIRPGERVLFKTDNSNRLDEPGFLRDYVGVSEAAAERLAEIRPALIGIDYLSIGPYDHTNSAVHRALLGAGIVLLEGLDLSLVEPGEYELICAPIRIAGCEGAPARALLVR